MKREVMSIFLKFKFLGRGEVSYDKPEKREGMSILLTFIRINQSTHSRVSCGQLLSAFDLIHRNVKQV